MATFTIGADPQVLPATYALEGSGTMVLPPSLPPAQAAVNQQATGGGTLNTSTANKSTKAPATHVGASAEQSSGGFDWFEDFHVVPRFFEFGNLLANQSVPIEVFCAFRKGVHEWTSFVNNAGSGVVLTGAPSLPSDLDALTGVEMTLDVSTNGPPFVDDTLDFGFTGVGTIYVPIMIQRIVLWGLEPEMPFRETLASLTDVHESKDGSEKRAKLRYTPRQSWDYRYIMEDGPEAVTLENLAFDFQSLSFGVPVWDEDCELTAAAAPGTFTISVDATAYRNFQEGGFAVLFTDQSTFDVLEIDSGGISASSITFVTPTVNSYPAGLKVYPLATCRADQRMNGSRWPVGLRELRVRFTVKTAGTDLSDLSPFSSYNGKLLLDVGNTVRGRSSYGFEVALARIDNQTGLVAQESPWERGKITRQLRIRADGRQAKSELRGMVHALAGKAISFYMPTDQDDLLVVSNLVSAANTMDVQNVGYAQFVQERQPKNVVRVNFVDGSTPLLRGVTGSSMVSATVEQLTLDGSWPSTITPAEVSRVDFVEKLRLDSDRIEFQHDRERAYMTAPVRTVFE